MKKKTWAGGKCFTLFTQRTSRKIYWNWQKIKPIDLVYGKYNFHIYGTAKNFASNFWQ